MKQLRVPFVSQLAKDTPAIAVSTVLDGLSKNPIEMVPWPDFAYKPAVAFAIAHSHDCLFIKYYVTEDNIRAVYRQTNDPVYRDSCVEFFISFNGEADYYNLEFNCLGTCMGGFGSERNHRQLLPEKVIREIKRSATLAMVPGPDQRPVVKWELTLFLPAAAFCFHNFINLSQQQCRVNFYKCGDDLPKPHFLAWNTIEAPEPDFHRPEFFGELIFL